MEYTFTFTYSRRRGRVEVCAAGATVIWGGICVQQECIRNPELNLAIFKARLAFSENFTRVIYR